VLSSSLCARAVQLVLSHRVESLAGLHAMFATCVLESVLKEVDVSSVRSQDDKVTLA
jgi:hypothetical protein